MSATLGVDVGGTFTDFFLVDEAGRIRETVVGFQRGKMEELAKRAAERAGRHTPGASLFLAGETVPALRPG